MPGPHAIPITLTAADRAMLEGWARRRKTVQALALRTRIVAARRGFMSVAEQYTYGAYKGADHDPSQTTFSVHFYKFWKTRNRIRLLSWVVETEA
jgi:hypothetical protein